MRLHSLFLFLVVPLVLGPYFSHGAETVAVDKTFNGREIKVMSGRIIQVQLEEAGAAGYVWEIQDLDATYFEVVSVRTEPPDKPGLVGGPVKKVWLIRVKEKGYADLQFFHYRPWEGKDKAANTFRLKVRIL